MAVSAISERLVCTVAPVDAVLRLARHFPVFPCRRSPEEVLVRGDRKLMKAKSPLTQHGLRDATRDESTIRAWWRQWPDALAGVPTGAATQLVVLDFDTPKADAAANEWMMEHTEQLLSTRAHTTLNGGKHYLYRLPPGQEYRNGVCLTLGGTRRNGIDLRAEGGYIVWWPLHGGMTMGEIAALPAGLVDEQRNEKRELPPLTSKSPEKWASDRKLVADALAYLDPADYGLWSRAGLAIHLASAGSDDGFELWHAWSAGEITGDVPHSYGGINDCRYHWGSYRHDKDRSKLVTLGTLFELAKAQGYVPPKAVHESPPLEVYEKDLVGRVGSMLVTGAEPQFDEDPDEVLIDVMKLDGKQLLTEYAQRRSKFGTAPFDPEGERFRLYPGGVTIWSGFPGAGKTTLLRQFVCHCLARGSSVFVASFEEDPRDMLVSLAAVAAGREFPNVHQMQWFIDAYGERFRLWGVIGIAQHRKLLAVIRKLASQGVRHAIIDSLMCLDIANDDFEAQRKFANLLAATAKASNIHIHLVAHPRKLVSSSQEPDINDVAGAREIGGIADNVIFVRRSETETESPLATSTPMCIAIRKQRHGRGALGNLTGWFHREWRQFNIEQFPGGPVRYLPADAYT